MAKISIQHKCKLFLIFLTDEDGKKCINQINDHTLVYISEAMLTCSSNDFTTSIATAVGATTYLKQGVHYQLPEFIQFCQTGKLGGEMMGTTNPTPFRFLSKALISAILPACSFSFDLLFWRGGRSQFQRLSLKLLL